MVINIKRRISLGVFAACMALAGCAQQVKPAAISHEGPPQMLFKNAKIEEVWPLVLAKMKGKEYTLVSEVDSNGRNMFGYSGVNDLLFRKNVVPTGGDPRYAFLNEGNTFKVTFSGESSEGGLLVKAKVEGMIGKNPDYVLFSTPKPLPEESPMFKEENSVIWQVFDEISAQIQR